MVNIPTYVLRFTIRTLERLPAQPFLGFLLHRAFGPSLRDVSCGNGIKGCPSNLKSCASAYKALYETVPGNIPHAAKHRNYPHPYVIQPAPIPERGIEPGAYYMFNVVLIGEAIQYLPCVIRALEDMGRMGLPAIRVHYDLVMVDAQTREGCQRLYRDGLLVEKQPPAPEMDPAVAECEEATLLFVTPLCLETKEGALVKEGGLTYEFLMERMAHRAGFFQVPQDAYSVFSFSEDKRKLAKDIRTVQDNLAWVHLRYHTRNHPNGLKQGGLVGSITFAGKLAPFLPLLRIGARINVGKSTALGLGHYLLKY